MSVKGIFRILIGIIMVIVISCLLIEWFNLTLYSNQVKRLTKLSISKAMQYFGEETYKREDTHEYTNDIYGNDGSIALSGKFYDGTTTNEIYDNLYTNNYDFKEWCENYANNWYNISILYSGIKNELVTNETKKMFVEFYNDVKMTPANLGIPYIDKNTTTRIAKWNLVKVLCNGNEQNIVLDDGEPYVKYNGYNLYYNTLELTNINYKVYDLTNDGDKREFEELTNLDTNVLGLGISGESFDYFGRNVNEERNKICVLDLSYSIKIKYSGITPFRQVISFVWNNEVEGLDSIHQTRRALGTPTDTSELKGGSTNNLSTLPIQDHILYYIIN